MLVANVILIGLASLFAIPCFVLFSEILAAVVWLKKVPQVQKVIGRPSVAVIVPAHNESKGILQTLYDVKSQLLSDDRLLVVADNCCDDTAEVARAAGVEVVERYERTKVGKGYALDHGLKYVALDPRPIVIFIDADCRVELQTIDQLAALCALIHKPIQALDLMTAPEQSSIDVRAAEFAWRIKNWVRPLGLSALNLPCQLMGTGMAFPWDVIQTSKLANNSIVEDLKLGIDLAATKSPPYFCPSAKVTSYFPMSDHSAKQQRRRWEQGHLHMIWTTIPTTIAKSIWQRNIPLLALVLDLGVPPLSLLVILLLGTSAISAMAIHIGVPPTAAIISLVSLATLVAALVMSWFNYGRDILPIRSVPFLTFYIFNKIPFYFSIFLSRTAPRWIRADRTKRR